MNFESSRFFGTPGIKNDMEFKTQNKEMKAKNQRYRNMKNQNTER